MLLDNKVALVTGAGSGIGRAITLALANAGACVVAADANEQTARATAELTRDTGGKCLPLAMEVSHPEEHARAVKFAVQHFGALHIACNNAGISLGKSKRSHLLPDLPPSDWEQIMHVNLFGVFYGMRHQIPQMLQDGGGSIVNIASVMGQVASPGLCAYVTSKHGVIGLTKAASVEFADKNIRINAVAPGYVQTPILSRLPSEKLRSIADRHPMRRLGQAKEVAEMVLWLCSDKASFSTGSVFNIDGGYLAI